MNILPNPCVVKTPLCLCLASHSVCVRTPDGKDATSPCSPPCRLPPCRPCRLEEKTPEETLKAGKEAFEASEETSKAAETR